ncbi:pyridoxal-dependent decarboxylase [Enhygromyxa salina]|uniref:Histidine decarboxylase n=1 Tax=Enhygromyxa salina TaxID=215803 RepID=A0A2S9YRZ7_9BACT|nr:pyridoxal-dependent decarboxylase [Enhygromyxa salina]PRQ07868.1 Histidine decarboxylase [Enhygromyxa salina]
MDAFHRRGFLGLTATAAALAGAGCYPRHGNGPAGRSPAAPDLADPRLRAMAGLPQQKQLMLGYPVNMATPPPEFFAWRRELEAVGLGQFAFNNVGDPYQHSHIAFNTHMFERELVRRFGALYRFAAHDTWGFLSNSGTDSNMHGLYMGRTILSGHAGIEPNIYFTKEAHYSIQILADLLGLQRIDVGTHSDGRMSAESLAQRLSEYPNQPALVVATIGTTFKGAVDSLDEIQAALVGRTAYVHVDAALFGGYLPHTPFAARLWQRKDGSSSGAPRYDSIAVSCHKFFGFPSPAGLFISTHAAFAQFHELFSQVHDPEYLQQVPGTITCSRDAVKPAEFVFFSTDRAFARQRDDAEQILRDTSYVYDQMQTHFPELSPVRASPLSNTIYFRQPSEEIVDAYTLATMTIAHEGKREPHAHVIVMPHATREILDNFLTDLEHERAG